MAGLLLALLLTGCPAKTVRVGLHDSAPPKLTIMVVAGNEQIKLLGGDGEPATIRMPAWQEAYVLAFGSDTLGVKEVAVTSLSTGKFLNYTDGNLATEVTTFRDTTAEGMGLSRLDATCKPIFGPGEFLLRATARDWAGNAIYSPTLRLVKVPSPDAHLGSLKNWALPGGTVTLQYATSNAEKVQIGNEVQQTESGSVTVPPSQPARELVLKAIGEFDTAWSYAWIYQVPNAGTPVIGGMKTNPPVTAYLMDYDLIYDVSGNTMAVSIPRIDYVSQKYRDTVRTGEDNSDHVPIKLLANGSSGTAEFEFVPRFEHSYPCDTVWLPLGEFQAVGSLGMGSMLVSNREAAQERKDPLKQQPIIEVRNGTGATLVLEMAGKWLQLAPGETSDAFSGLSVYLDKAVLLPGNTNGILPPGLEYSVQNRWCKP